MNTNTEANGTVEILFRAEKDHVNPFLDLTLDVVFTIPGCAEKSCQRSGVCLFTSQIERPPDGTDYPPGLSCASPGSVLVWYPLNVCEKEAYR